MALPIRRARGGRSASVQAVGVTDFSGGLNLDSGQFNLRKNEVAELVDMDVVGRGGVRRRRAIRLLPTAHAGLFDECPRSVWSFEASSSNRYLYLVARWNDGGNRRILFHSVNGGAFTPFTGTAANFGLANNAAVANLDAKVRVAVAGDAVWGVWDYTGDLSTRPKPFKIDSANTLSLPNEAGVAGTNSGWTENIFSPEAGSVAGLVNGRCVAAHYGFLWVANTVEGGSPARFRSRVRWSHPGVYDRWRSDDYIDVEVGKDADEVTAIQPFRDHLIVFKNRSVHAIYGDNADNFTVVNLSNQFGAVSQEAVVASPFGVFFFDRATGVWVWDGSQFRWLFGPLNNLLRDGTVGSDRRDNVQVGWVDSRLWVGVPWTGSSAARSRTLVYDPTIGSAGAWTMYSQGLGPFASLRKTDGSLLHVAGCSGSRLLQSLEQTGDVDELSLDGSGNPVGTPIVGSFRTAWVEAGIGAEKQWKRPDLIVSADGDIRLVVDAFFDYVYEEDQPRKTFYVTRLQGSDDLVWANESVADAVNVWDARDWAGSETSTLIARGSNIGRSRAVSLRFSTPSGDELPRWSVDGLLVKFRPKRVRG